MMLTLLIAAAATHAPLCRDVNTKDACYTIPPAKCFEEGKCGVKFRSVGDMSRMKISDPCAEWYWCPSWAEIPPKLKNWRVKK